MLDQAFRVVRWTMDRKPHRFGRAPRLEYACLLELRNRKGAIAIGLDLPGELAERLAAIVSKGTVRLEAVFSEGA